MRAVVAFSGGQDSTTCLAWALDRWGAGNVHAVSFNYGQRHAVELAVADRIAERWGVKHTTLTLPAFRELGAAALTNPSIAVADAASVDREGSDNEHAERAGLPSTFVPGRNLVFLGLVAAYAAQHDIANIVTGVCEADDAGYPDCRADFIASLQATARLAMGRDDLVIHTPLMDADKAATFHLADELGVIDTIIRDTHTCYEGDRSKFHPWGYGCGECPACVERAKGYEQFALTAYA